MTPDAFFADILARPGERPKVVYVLSMIDRIGQLAGELFYLVNVFDPEAYDLTLVTLPPQRTPRVNQTVYRLCTRGLTVHHSEDHELIWKIGNSDQRIETPGGLLYLVSDASLLRDYRLQLRDTPPRRFFSLQGNDFKVCARLRAMFGIPPKAPLVTLHVRDSGYLPQRGYHSYRDAAIETYFPAIRWLAENGYYVVRLGDPSMEPLRDLPPQVIDGPHHPRYSNDFDAYFVAQSRFYLGMHSGPYSLARGFNVPMCITNAVIQPDADGHDRDILIFKKYRSQRLDRFLSYEEVGLSPALHFNKQEHFDQAGLVLEPNTAEEILATTQEMAGVLDGRYGRQAERDAAQRRAKAAQHKVHVYKEHTRPKQPYHALYWLGCRIGQEFLDRNPWFLGHDFGQ